MKIRFAAGGAAALTLALALGASACGDKDKGNANANNSNATAGNANTAPATPLATPTPDTSGDTAIKNTTEAALTKAGVTGVTVEVKGGEVTLKGEVPAAKFTAAQQAAQESGAKKVNNQLSKK
jgi:osmotically-inducible protein OsmY